MSRRTLQLQRTLPLWRPFRRTALLNPCIMICRHEAQRVLRAGNSRFRSQGAFSGRPCGGHSMHCPTFADGFFHPQRKEAGLASSLPIARVESGAELRSMPGFYKEVEDQLHCFKSILPMESVDLRHLGPIVYYAFVA